MVAIPFKDEDPAVVSRNLEIAAGHDRVDEVWAVGTSVTVAERAAAIVARKGKKVEVFPEERLGRFRPGKGDAMNTALRRAAGEGVDRLHFYDADIVNFSADWIDGAERGADGGFDVVRHTFPRASTDAMVTWFITKPMLAIRFPGTLLPRIGQPLGGELLLTGKSVDALATNPAIAARSDWGIDTVLTHGVVAAGLALFEHYVAAGKQHALYGSLDELKTMAVECFDAVNALPAIPPPPVRHGRDPDGPVPAEMREQRAYSVERTLGLLEAPPTSGEEEAATSLGPRVREAYAGLLDDSRVEMLDAEVWYEFLTTASAGFSLDDPGWRDLLFRMWIGRVVHYTLEITGRGYEEAMSYLAGTVDSYEQRSLPG